MSIPLISVIVPIYNAEIYLRQNLDSILNQTLKDIELICVDDGSTDFTLKILKEYQEKDSRIIIIQQNNQKAGIARNTGLKIAKGKYIIFLDADDFFKDTMLEELYNKAEIDNADTVVCSYYNYDAKTNKVLDIYTIHSSFVKQSPFSAEDIKNSIFSFCRPNPWTKLFKRDFFLENNIQFDDLVSSNDFCGIYTAVAASKRISILNKPLIYYRLNQLNNLTAKRKINLLGFKEDLQALENLRQNLIRLNLYNTFKASLINRGKQMFKKFKMVSHKKLAKSILSEELYRALFE